MHDSEEVQEPRDGNKQGYDDDCFLDPLIHWDQVKHNADNNEYDDKHDEAHGAPLWFISVVSDLLD